MKEIGLQFRRAASSSRNTHEVGWKSLDEVHEIAKMGQGRGVTGEELAK